MKNIEMIELDSNIWSPIKRPSGSSSYASIDSIFNIFESERKCLYLCPKEPEQLCPLNNVLTTYQISFALMGTSASLRSGCGPSLGIRPQEVSACSQSSGAKSWTTVPTVPEQYICVFPWMSTSPAGQWKALTVTDDYRIVSHTVAILQNGRFN